MDNYLQTIKNKYNITTKAPVKLAEPELISQQEYHKRQEALTTKIQELGIDLATYSIKPDEHYYLPLWEDPQIGNKCVCLVKPARANQTSYKKVTGTVTKVSSSALYLNNTRVSRANIILIKYGERQLTMFRLMGYK